MAVPETTVHENRDAETRKNDVGFAGQRAHMQPVAKALPMERATDAKFRCRVGGANARHCPRALLWRECVGH